MTAPAQEVSDGPVLPGVDIAGREDIGLQEAGKLSGITLVGLDLGIGDGGAVGGIDQDDREAVGLEGIDKPVPVDGGLDRDGKATAVGTQEGSNTGVVVVHGDIDREAVGQIIVNLMSNAAKYGEEGGWVGVSVEGAADGIQVSVSDRGIGISETDLNHIFDHFYRSSDSMVRRKKGTGIGLTIVSYIVEAHGGTISVESAPGAGTTFTVTCRQSRYSKRM